MSEVGSALRPGGGRLCFAWAASSTTLGGRVVGRLSNPAAQMINVVHLRKPQFPPAVTLSETPTDEEAAWLLALAILQVAGFNVLETVWTNQRL